ncbi:putative transcriptional regulator, GntR family [Moritella sp. PE36]|uniref:GntR family transcriptional regulator n=1 Tax=Moritella sp. PE36 TaxID=58051 RepID=UPI00015689B9|nr:GntR family transcriptional regulator [Moritella sp. PE36]EDM66958.1 putative transcriptional regulator, GntR family [Moritella sp. PE36]
MSELSSSVETEGKSGSMAQDDIVYAHIFDAILERRLPPGTKLNEEALGDIFGVSRTIIRRSLLRLSHEQVVVIRPNRGAIVAAPSVEEAKQVFIARQALEAAITELAVMNATAKQISSLRKLIVLENAATNQGDLGKAIRLSGEFHLQLAEMSANVPLLNFQRSLVSLTSLIIAQYEVGNSTPCVLDEHSRLLDAIEAKDVVTACQLMQEHLEHIESKLNLDGETVSSDLHVVFSNVLNKK